MDLEEQLAVDAVVDFRTIATAFDNFPFFSVLGVGGFIIGHPLTLFQLLGT